MAETGLNLLPSMSRARKNSFEKGVFERAQKSDELAFPHRFQVGGVHWLHRTDHHGAISIDTDRNMDAPFLYRPGGYLALMRCVVVSDLLLGGQSHENTGGAREGR
jgi:hypothetical protein